MRDELVAMVDRALSKVPRAEVHELLADVRRIREADGDDVVSW